MDLAEERAVNDGSDANSTSSFSSALSSTDLDTESSTSFFQERSTTLGSLIGIAGEADSVSNDRVPFGAPSDRAIPVHLPRSSTSSHCLSFMDESVICGQPKLCCLIPFGACKGLCYANKGTCKALWCAKKGCNTREGQPETALFSASLGRLLVAERYAERSQERDADAYTNIARVYINIMYEESAGLERVSLNPLFDIHTTSSMQVNSTSAAEQVLEGCRQHQNLSREFGPSSSFRVEDESCVKVNERMIKTITFRNVSAAPVRRQPTLPVKGQKRLPTSLCEPGCVSYMWTRLRV